jgi:Flavin reductase like domain
MCIDRFRRHPDGVSGGHAPLCGHRHNCHRYGRTPPPRHDGDRRNVTVVGSAVVDRLRQPGNSPARHPALRATLLRERIEREQARLSKAFSGALPPEERFELGAWRQTADGISFLADAQARVFCRKVAMIPFGTHSIVIGEVEEIGMRETVEPLLYQDATYCVSVPAPQAAA